MKKMPRILLEEKFKPERLIKIIESKFGTNYFSSSELLDQIDSKEESRTGIAGKKRSLASLNKQLEKMCPPKSDLLERNGKGKNIRYRMHLEHIIHIEKFLRTLNRVKEYTKSDINELIVLFNDKAEYNDEKNNNMENKIDKSIFWRYVWRRIMSVSTLHGNGGCKAYT